VVSVLQAEASACNYSVELPHWLYCSWFDVCWSFGEAGLEWYPCCRLKHNIRISIFFDTICIFCHFRGFQRK